MLNDVVTKPVRQIEASATFADLIVEYLHQLEVDYVFGVPGGAIEPLFNALARHARAQQTAQLAFSGNPKDLNHGVQAVVARHEAGAAFMADGYARETGKLGVCCSTTGPGATNMLTAVASAYTDRTPMLVITPQIALPNFGKYGMQESSSEIVDTVAMFESCTRYNSLVSHPDQLERKLYTALLHAFSRPRGPVHLSIPMDIMGAAVSNQNERFALPNLSEPYSMDPNDYAKLVETIDQARRVVICVGGGCRQITDQIHTLAEHLDATLISTPSGKRWIRTSHPNYRGVFGFAGHQSAYDALTEEGVDAIIAVGTSLGELSTRGWNSALLNRRLVHICNTVEDMGRSPMAQLHVMGNYRCIFDNLLNDFNESCAIQRVAHKTNTDGHFPAYLDIHLKEHAYADTQPLKPQRLMRTLGEKLPANTRFVVDAGNSWAWMIHYFFQKDGTDMRLGAGFSSMAWGISAAIGTSLADRNSPVVCIAGDGAYLMSSHEITVAVEQGLSTIFVILNDAALGMVKHGQRMGGGEPIGFSLPEVDFAGIARASGANGIAVRTAYDLEQLDFEALCQLGRPTLIDVHIDPEEPPPIGARLKTLRGKKPDAD